MRTKNPNHMEGHCSRPTFCESLVSFNQPFYSCGREMPSVQNLWTGIREENGLICRWTRPQALCPEHCTSEVDSAPQCQGKTNEHQLCSQNPKSNGVDLRLRGCSSTVCSQAVSSACAGANLLSGEGYWPKTPQNLLLSLGPR